MKEMNSKRMNERWVAIIYKLKAVQKDERTEKDIQHIP